MLSEDCLQTAFPQGDLCLNSQMPVRKTLKKTQNSRSILGKLTSSIPSYERHTIPREQTVPHEMLQGRYSTARHLEPSSPKNQQESPPLQGRPALGVANRYREA